MRSAPACTKAGTIQGRVSRAISEPPRLYTHLRNRSGVGERITQRREPGATYRREQCTSPEVKQFVPQGRWARTVRSRIPTYSTDAVVYLSCPLGHERHFSLEVPSSSQMVLPLGTRGKDSEGIATSPNCDHRVTPTHVTNLSYPNKI